VISSPPGETFILSTRAVPSPERSDVRTRCSWFFDSAETSGTRIMYWLSRVATATTSAWS
jgi:hypothetical protein